MPINSRQKGAVGERELRDWLKEWVLPGGIRVSARRGRQYNGLDGRDVVTNIRGMHIECKRVEGRTPQAVRDAINQAETDAGPGEVGVVFWRRNGEPWMVFMYSATNKDGYSSMSAVRFLEELGCKHAPEPKYAATHGAPRS